MSPLAARSLRMILTGIKDLALDDDQEIQQMEHCLSAIMDSVEKRKTTPAEMQGTIEDVGMLRQTSILAMGAQPRMPKRQGQAVVAQDSIMELPADALLGAHGQARQRTGLDTSLAEILVDAGGLSLDTLRSRRTQASTTDLAAMSDLG